MAQELPCPNCKKKIDGEATVCPYCQSPFTVEQIEARKSELADGNKAATIGCLAILLFIGGCVWWNMPTEEEEAAQAAAKAEEKKKGFHCLSGWDGSHPQLVETVKSNLRDPDSFEHVETKVTPTAPNGNHILFMKYRARNGFGGMNVNQAGATMKNDDCTIILNTMGDDLP